MNELYFVLVLLTITNIHFSDVSCKSGRMFWSKINFDKLPLSHKIDGKLRDRLKEDDVKITKSPIERSRELYKPKFHPAWMDYCDPYHCNDYHKRACGLNRANMKFQWFQSGCHIILNNMCYIYRGFLKYDIIEPKFCEKFVPSLRVGCPIGCDDLLSPVCSRSEIDHQLIIFRNQCYMDRANCRVETFNEYTEVDFSLCTDNLRIG